MKDKKIETALISVYHKDNLEEIVKELNALNIKIISTGGTAEFIKNLNIDVITVEEITGYPSILGGRVKTLHPAIFGGILFRRDNTDDQQQIKQYNINNIDLVIVDLYPFQETVNSGASEEDIIEKIDIGGISLIRAAAKNFNDVVIIPSRDYYPELISILKNKKGITSFEERKKLALEAFNVTSHYDTLIFNYFNSEKSKISFKKSILSGVQLRYGENPHQKGYFYGNLNEMFEKIQGKEISYNNLLDIEAGIYLIDEFKEPTFAILKHNNPCGIASSSNIFEAWKLALAADPVSAFGGILIANKEIDEKTAEDINQLFFEVIIAPSYTDKAIDILSSKKNRIILKRKPLTLPNIQFRSLLNGVIEQDRDIKIEEEKDLQVVTNRKPTTEEIKDMIFANKVVKHCKSNAIVLAKNQQLIANGIGQTSRVDALKQAIVKAKNFGFSLEGCVMASDAFFPFPDCVEIAFNEGIMAVIQPGGSIRDNESIEFCNRHNMTMVFTGIRHFKH